jgi:DNA-binding SARP family transcriptional activator
MTTTIDREFDRLSQSVNQTLTTHQQQLQLEREQIKCLTQLLSSCVNFSLDEHCLSAIKRLTELLERHQQSATKVCDVLNTLTQAKDARNLTIDSQGEMATTLTIELAELAQRLGINPPTKLSKAAHSENAWSRLMNTHLDPEGYQWQAPNFKRGFHHNPKLKVIGTKAVKLASGSSLN